MDEIKKPEIEQEAPAEDKADEKLAQAIVDLCVGHPIRIVSVALQLAQMKINKVIGNQNFVDDAQP